jgi:hypothetical protein
VLQKQNARTDIADRAGMTVMQLCASIKTKACALLK